MRKILSLLIIPFISLFFVTEVNADTLTSSVMFENFDTYVNDYYTYKDNIDYLINYWEENFSNDYPYYGIIDFFDGTYVGQENPVFILFYTNNNSVITTEFNEIRLFSYNDGITYDSNNNTYSYSDVEILPYFLGGGTIKSFKLLLSNGLIYNKADSEFDSILFPSYTSIDLNFTLTKFEISDGDVFPDIISLYENSYDFGLDDYIEVDLNNYSYVALSLKNYDVEEFDSTFYVKGQACPTVVYNYGLEERLNTDRCNIPFDNFTPIRYRISERDINNHFIYYFKAYDISIENKIKVDTSIFNIHYITEEEKDNPILDINGHKYSTIPFDSLPTTANKNESENFVPGASEETSFSDIFTAPLEFLKSIWNSISSVFGLITDFISLLPIELQSLLYAGFALALTLGIIKILL